MYLTTQRMVNPHKQRKRSMKGNRDLENYVKSVEGSTKRACIFGQRRVQ